MKVDEEKVREFVTGRGREIIKGLIDERPARLDKLLAGAKVDTVLTLMRIVGSSKQDSSRVAAGKILLDLAAQSSGKTPKSPEQVKRETEQRIKKMMEKKNSTNLLPSTPDDG